MIHIPQQANVPHLSRKSILALLCLALAGWGAPSVHALTGTINGDVADGQANSDGTVSNTTALYGRLGADSGVRHSIVHVFQIPSSILSDPTQQFSAVTYTTKTAQGSTMTLNDDLYGLGYATSPAISSADFYEGSLDTTSVLLKDNFITPSTPSYSVVSESGTALVNYMNDCLTAARAAGASPAYVFIRNSLDAYTWSGIYLLGMNEAGGAYVPTLGYTTVTVPAWNTVPLGGGGFVTGLVSDSTGADLYARTDVGGLFKWNATTGTWANLTDKIVPTTTPWRTSRGLANTMSVAVDPSNPNNLYVAVGGNAAVSGPNAGIYASADKGVTWTEITTGTPDFVINGNDEGAGVSSRQKGERLAVDPNNPNIVWYGSQNSGLMKGQKSGSSWTWSQVSSASVPFGTAKYGVTFVICDKNGASTITYAGVYDGTGGTGGVYKFDGTIWSKVSGVAVTTPSHAAVASDGTFYVTGNTGVAKMARGGSLADITPVAGNTYCGLAINPAGTTVYVANVQPNGSTSQIWRSTNGGTSGTWVTQGTGYFNNLGYSASRIYPQEPDGTLSYGYQWFGNVAALWVNPANANELWASDYYGVQRTQNANLMGNTAVNTQPTWYRLLKNLEETLVFSVGNAATGNRLLTGCADIGGFRYATSTSQRPFASGNGGASGATGSKNVTSLDFCESNANVCAYSWALDPNVGTGAVSLDGGTNWMRFGQIARKSIANSTTAGWETWDLGNYLTKLRASGVTTVTLIVAGGATWWEDTPSMTFDSRENTNKPQLVLNGGAPINPTADTVVYLPTPTTNYGNLTTLSVRKNGGFDLWSYLKFNLNSVTTISSAQLKLYRESSTDTHTLEVGVHACVDNSAWIEGNGGTDNSPANEMTWNNKPKAMSDSGGTGSPLTSTPYYQQGGVNLRGGRIAISSTDPTIMVWAPIGSTTRYTADRGVTWAASTGAPPYQIKGIYTSGNGDDLDCGGRNLAADRVNGNFYLADFADWDSVTNNYNHDIYRSQNGGASWSLVATLPIHSSNCFTPQLVAAPASPTYPTGGDVWLCDDVNTGSGGLWRSVNGGVNWSKFANIGRVSQVAFGKSPTGTGYTVYAHGESTGGVRGVYRSDDYGASWTAMAALPSNVSILSLAGDRQNAGKVFLGTNGRGLFESQ